MPTSIKRKKGRKEKKLHTVSFFCQCEHLPLVSSFPNKHIGRQQNLNIWLLAHGFSLLDLGALSSAEIPDQLPQTPL